MNRRGFFKFLGIGAAAAIVAPRVLASERHESYDEMMEKIVLTIDNELRKDHKNIERNLTIFEEPRKGYDYSIGVFNGDGLGGSPSCISVMRIGEGNEPSVQVAEYVTTKHNPAQLVSIIAQIARRYGEKCKDIRGPMIVIEQVMAPGDMTQAQLKIMGFTRFFKVTGTTNDKNGKNVEWKKDGWYTTKFSLSVMMDRFTEAVREGWYKPQSIQLGCDLTQDVGTKYPTAVVKAAAQSYMAQIELQ